MRHYFSALPALALIMIMAQNAVAQTPVSQPTYNGATYNGIPGPAQMEASPLNSGIDNPTNPTQSAQPGINVPLATDPADTMNQTSSGLNSQNNSSATTSGLSGTANTGASVGNTGVAAGTGSTLSAGSPGAGAAKR